MKPGQMVLPKGNTFSREGVTLLGVQGEIIFNFDQNRKMFDCSFYIRDGEMGTSIGDEDWRSLYIATKAICDSTETRTGFETSLANGSIEWAINGDARIYKLTLVRRVLGQRIERGLEIAITQRRR